MLGAFEAAWEVDLMHMEEGGFLHCFRYALVCLPLFVWIILVTYAVAALDWVVVAVVVPGE